MQIKLKELENHDNTKCQHGKKYWKIFRGLCILLAVGCIGLAGKPEVRAESEDVAVDEAHFPDKNFRNYVKEFDLDADGILSKRERDYITEIDLEGKAIVHIDGIKYFSNLEYLNCSYGSRSRPGRIDTVDVSGMTHLKKLEYTAGCMEKLNVTGCSSLTELYCGINELTELDVSTCVNLQKLNCRSNPIEDLNVTNCGGLQMLNCSGINLKELNLNGYSNLVELYYESNRGNLASLDVTGCTSLQILYCRDSHLEELNVAGNKRLQFIYCSDNYLRDLDVSGCDNLQKLECMSNEIQKLNVTGAYNLQELDCYLNRLQELDLADCRKLQRLSCSSNDILELDVSGYTELKEIICDYCEMQKLKFAGCPNLETVSCYYNELQELDFTGCPNFRYVYCNNNELEGLDFTGCPNLELVYCYDNKLQELDFTGCTNLWELSCYGNQLTELDLTEFHNLVYLSCYNNNLKELKVGNPKCAVYAIYNYLDEVPPEHKNTWAVYPMKEYIISGDFSKETNEISYKSLGYNLYKIEDSVEEYSFLFDHFRRNPPVIEPEGMSYSRNNYTFYVEPFEKEKTVRFSYKSTDESLKYNMQGCNIELHLINLPFEDVHPKDWFFDSVRYVYENGQMSGLDKTVFGSAQPLARSHFAVILHRIANAPAMEYTPKFPDIEDHMWYTDAVLWASSQNIVNGYTDTGKFGPADYVNREQMASMLYRYASQKGYDVSAQAELGRFTDADQVNAFAKEAMQWAAGAGIITGKDNETRLDPQGTASRAECAAIIMRFVEKYGEAENGES